MSKSRQPRYAEGKGHAKRRRGWRKFVSFKAFALYFLGFALVVVTGLGIAYAMTDVPEANEFAQSESTIVYWNDGETELGRFSAENREIVDISQIPQHVRDAVVAAEDRSFYDNNGFDPVGIMRAAMGQVRGNSSAGGGSTITQQYVKNYYLTQEQTLSRKAKELIIAVKVDQRLSKSDILASYLNTIWFGRSLYGVQTAAKSYYGKTVSELSLEEGAGLAAILRSPHRYDPTISAENKQRFEERFRYVLDGMVAMGKLDKKTADAAQIPKVLPEKKTNRYGGPNGYLLQQVRKELKAAGFDEEDLDSGGFRVVSTFDPKAQSAAVKAVRNERPQTNAENVHVGLAAVKPSDGSVVAMYGGEDAVDQPFNDAIDAKPHAGSTLKPFTLAAALKEGISLESRYAGNSPFDPPELGPPVNNQNEKDYGKYIDLVTAVERSINTAFVDLAMQIGPKKVEEVMVSSGIPEDTPDMASKGGRITLGIAPISPMDMAESYATLASGGKHSDWHTVKSVTEPGGAVAYEAEPKRESVLDPGVVADVTYAMTQVVEGKNGTGRVAKGLGRPSAGKTGTHQDLSAWYSGYTPQLAASVALFRIDHESGDSTTKSLDGVEGMDTFTGGRFPARIWTVFMVGALEGMDKEEFPEPAEVGEAVNPSPTPTPTPTPTRTPEEDDEENEDEDDKPNRRPTEDPSDDKPNRPDDDDDSDRPGNGQDDKPKDDDQDGNGWF